MTYLDTGLWADVRGLPGALGDTLAAADGVAEAAELLRADGVERIVATGNGAAYYVAHALWLASLESAAAGPPIVAVPCGIAVRDRFRWQPGDAVLAVSSSGEFRDVVEIAQRAAGQRPCIAITASAESSLATAASTSVLQRVASQRAVTHTQALAGAYAAGLALWAAVTGDAALAAVLEGAPDAAAHAVAEAEAWDAGDGLDGAPPPAAAVVVGGGTAWAAALELALMLKEISRIPAEGVETREGATSAMFGLDRGHLMVSLDPAGDPLGDEAVRLCAAAGATTLRLPSATGADARLAPITTLPAAAALSAELALAAGHDVDRPTWTDAYYETARSGT
ncbi:MAG TPA: SIS domain-containing protein [Solirubrobacteraceae bacterium]|nr:SIS domain-containing protein [Solirubrobacteraceae bacterium]